MHRRNVSPTELARRAQVSRATVYVVLDSRSNNPTTMKQLAIGLATESDRGGKGRINPDVEREAARELLTAIGFGALIDGQTDDAPLVDLPDADQAERILSSLSRDPEMAALMAEAARRYPDATPAQRSMLAAALRLIPSNPMVGVRLPRAVEVAPKAWTAAEVTKLLETARGRAHEVWLWLSLGTGIRLGESRALTWPDVDTADMTITVRASRDHLTDELGPTKSRKIRVVDLPEEVMPLLVAHRVRQSPREQHVCTSSFSGHVPHPRTIDSWLRQVCEDAGVTAHGPHSTRHTYATLALEAGVPLKEVSEALGHSSVAITASTYSHAIATRRRRAANAIGAVLVPKEVPKRPKGSRNGTRSQP